MQAMDPIRRRVAGLYWACHELGKRILDSSAKASFRCESEQNLLVARHWVLHAREAVEATARGHLQDAYFDFDDIQYHFVVINRRVGE